MDILKIPILRRIYPSIVRRLFILIGKINFIYNIRNFNFEIDIRESIERKTYFQGDYERKRMKNLSQNSSRIKSKIFIDVGAYIGFYSILMSDIFEKIYAFEPLKRNFKILNKNILTNNLGHKIKTYNFALGSKEEKLFGGSNRKGDLLQSSGFSFADNVNNKSEKISIFRGDDIFSLNNEIITIKVDVEGFELDVLKGLEKLLINNLCYLQVEIWDHNSDSVFSLLNNLNYNFVETIEGDTYFSNEDQRSKS
jgi:FkbM family methyltransferase